MSSATTESVAPAAAVPAATATPPPTGSAPSTSTPAPADAAPAAPGYVPPPGETSTGSEAGLFPPISRMPTGTPRVPPMQFYTNVALFFFLTVYTALGVVLLQLPSLLLLYGPMPVLFALPPARRAEVRARAYRLYKWYIRWTESIFGSSVVILINTLAPTRLVVTGDLDPIRDLPQVVVMANHQIYPDWVYLWSLARLVNHHADMKILLMSVLQYLPVFGIGMTFFEFIFLKRKLSADRRTIIDLMSRQARDAPDLPMMLVIFPEGTLNTPNNRDTSRAFAKKADIADDPKYVILPKATGLFMCCDVLQPRVNTLFDVTVGYGGLKGEQIPYEEYLPDNVFFRGYGPREVHLHVQPYTISRLPGFDGAITDEYLAKHKDLAEQAAKQAEKSGGAFDTLTEARRQAFSDWVRGRFMQKDTLMERFYKDGAFPEVETGVPAPRTLTRKVFEVVPEPTDWLIVIFGWISVLYTLPFYLRLIWIALRVVF
ncbi:hypothetical protein HK105_201348 [Polyrhizophydium stewartii]|uniref:Phospholipid/glycerol acyltransferase domain-containing protein n=1 Tax=Polyrhizophydium stewartii TaxID=2732419 RepID=A0ABR4NHS5_9FUNG|nr:hypothetical protein HK105_002100 [Polyrhizophydium stewartii]